MRYFISSLFLSIISFLLSADICMAQDPVSVTVQFKDGHLASTGNNESLLKRLPPHYAGYYIEWTNEEDFLSRQPLEPNAKYIVEALIIRSEVKRFPEGWKERSDKAYMTYYLEAVSLKIKAVENSPQDS